MPWASTQASASGGHPLCFGRHRDPCDERQVCGEVLPLKARVVASEVIPAELARIGELPRGEASHQRAVGDQPSDECGVGSARHACRSCRRPGGRRRAPNRACHGRLARARAPGGGDEGGGKAVRVAAGKEAADQGHAEGAGDLEKGAVCRSTHPGVLCGERAHHRPAGRRSELVRSEPGTGTWERRWPHSSCRRSRWRSRTSST